MKLRDYDFIHTTKFPVSFSKETEDRYYLVEIVGVLRSDGVAYKGVPIIFFMISNWELSIKNGFSCEVMQLSDFVNIYGEYLLVEKTEKTSKVTLGTRKLEGRDYIIWDETDEYYFVESLYKTELETLGHMAYYVLKNEFENIREEDIKKGVAG